MSLLSFRTVIGIGVGAGAYVLAKFAVSASVQLFRLHLCPSTPDIYYNELLIIFYVKLVNPDSVEGLVLINIDTNTRGWLDWATQKVRTPRLLFLPFSSSPLHKHLCILISLTLMGALHQVTFKCDDAILEPHPHCSALH